MLISLKRIDIKVLYLRQITVEKGPTGLCLLLCLLLLTGCVRSTSGQWLIDTIKIIKIIWAPMRYGWAESAATPLRTKSANPTNYACQALPNAVAFSRTITSYAEMSISILRVE